MRLPRPFHQLPVLVDAPRLQAEVAALPPEAWASHPDGLPGCSAVRLISVGGAEDDGVHGPMSPTPWLGRLPYLRHVLASFGVVWGRSRLMRLAPGAEVPAHADINHHWHSRVRVHVPVFTAPAVRFHCGDASVHMAAGEAWIFDNWRRHRVENGAAQPRIHLVADTSGSAAFWRMASAERPRRQWLRIPPTPATEWPVLTELNQRTPVMPAAEVQLLVDDLRSELVAGRDDAESRHRLHQLHLLLADFCFDWRQLCLGYGLDGHAPEPFLQLTASVRRAAVPLAAGVTVRSNGVEALLVLEKLVLSHLVTGG